MKTTTAKISVSDFLGNVNIIGEELKYDIPSNSGAKKKLKNLFPDLKISESEIQKTKKELFTDNELST